MKSPVGTCGVDEAAHGERRFGGDAFDEARGNAGDAVGLAAVVTKGKFVEIGLQMLRTNGAGVRAEKPAFQQ